MEAVWIRFLRIACIFAERRNDKRMVMELKRLFEEILWVALLSTLALKHMNYRGVSLVRIQSITFIDYSTIPKMQAQFSEYHLERLKRLFKGVDSLNMLLRKSSSRVAAIQ